MGTWLSKVTALLVISKRRQALSFTLMRLKLIKAPQNPCCQCSLWYRKVWIPPMYCFVSYYSWLKCKSTSRQHTQLAANRKKLDSERHTRLLKMLQRKQKQALHMKYTIALQMKHRIWLHRNQRQSLEMRMHLACLAINSSLTCHQIGRILGWAE